MAGGDKTYPLLFLEEYLSFNYPTATFKTRKCYKEN